MAQTFPGQQENFFFRKTELTYVQQRLHCAGITVIRGRPRAGKSWLCGQALRSVAQNSSNTLIGFTRCTLQDADSLIRVIDDFYLRWFENATLLDQAKDLFEKNQGRWLPMVANAVSGLLEATQPLGPASGIASKALQKLGTGRAPTLQVPRLEYEQAQQFISALATIAQADRVILVLDSWEQSAKIEYEAEHLREFVRNPEAWTNTHFLISVESDGKADALLQSISSGVRPWIEIYNVPPLDIDGDPEEKKRLTTYLRNTVPACRSVERADVFLCLVDGYPGVLNNWTRLGAPQRLNTLDDLRDAATEAQLGRYPEFDKKLPDLDSATRQLCIRLALLPDSKENHWSALRPLLTNDVPASSLDRLVREGLIENATSPTFGHRTRSAYLVRWLIENCSNECRDECISLILAFAREIQTFNPDIGPFVHALVALSYPAELFGVDNCRRGFCEAAIGLSSFPIAGVLLLQTSKQLQHELDPSVAPLTAMGLFNALEYANTETVATDPNVFLGELRALQRSYSDNGQVRECVARALYNSSSYSGLAGDLPRSEDLLDELGALQKNYPTDNEVRQWFASGLFNGLRYAEGAVSLSRRDANTSKLRQLTREFPDDIDLRSAFASTLGEIALSFWTDQRLGTEPLIELRALSKRHTDDPTVSEGLARALFARLLRTLMLFDRKYDKDTLLGELRSIQQNNPAEGAIRSLFAEALLKSVINADFQYDEGRRDALREDLCVLYEAYPDDEKVRQCWESRYPPPEW